MKFYLILLLFSFFLLLGCTNIFDEKKIPPPQSEITCEGDIDCILVDGDICGCNSGGTTKTINKQYADAWNSQLQKEREGKACLAAMSQHISCFSEPKCVENKCVLVPNKQNVCNSNLYFNCRQDPKDTSLNAENNLRLNGISCKDVIQMCE